MDEVNQKKNNPERKVLASHVRRGRKLIPPFLASLGDRYNPFNWAKEIAPEAIWIALLVNQYGMIEGSKLVASLCKVADNIISDRHSPIFSRFSAFSELTAIEQNIIREKLSYLELKQITRCLYTLNQICPKHPLSFLYLEVSVDEFNREVQPDINKLTVLLYDRFSKISVLSAAAATYAAIVQGKLKMPKAILDKTITNLEEVKNYPDTEKSKLAAGAFRAAAPSNFGIMGYNESSISHENWLKLFWKDIGMNGNCINHSEIQYEKIPNTPHDQLIIGFRNLAKKQLSDRIKIWQPNLSEVEQYEVISALLARQVTIAIELASAPTIWTPNTAPILLRSMADVFLTLAWICDDPIRRSKEFIEYGLGAIKLDIAHRQKKLDENIDSDDAEMLQYMINMEKDWLSAQRMEQFIEVNLGNWAGSNTRKMAQESGYLDFYNYVYQPFSNVAHSSWSHIGKFNASKCQNPSHRPHWLGSITDFEPDPHWLYLCAKYLDKTFDKFDDFAALVIKDDSSLEHVINTLNDIYSTDQSTDF